MTLFHLARVEGGSAAAPSMHRVRPIGRGGVSTWVALVLLLAALPLAYGASLLFQPPRPTIREVGQVDITNGKFVFSASEAYWVEKGKILYPVKGATLIGNGPDAMNRVSMIGNDLALDSGVGTCGKEGQSVPVGVGQPTLRIDGLTVGGTA